MKKNKFKSKLNKKQKVVVGIASLLILTGGVVGFNVISKIIIEKKQIENRVELYQIPGREKVFMKGKVVPKKSEALFVKSEQGELDTIKVGHRDIVEKGAPLFTCKNSTQIKEISSLKEQIEVKKKEKNNAIDEESKKVIDEEIKQLNKQVSDLNKTAYSIVYAPFSGTVYLTEDKAEGKPVMLLETTEFYIKGQVNERDSYKISLDQGTEIKAMATNNKYIGKISYIGNRPLEGEELDTDSGMSSGMSQYRVKIDLDSQGDLKNGLNVQITAPSMDSTKKVPNTAVFKDGNKYYVFKVENGDTLRKVEIKVKELKGDYYLVEKGVEEGDYIIIDTSVRVFEEGDNVYTGINETQG